MQRCTNWSSHILLPNESDTLDAVVEFYDHLAPEYDLMTGFEQRFVTERPFFRLLVERYGIRRALDAGCGTGFHSLLLAQLGVEITAVDVSQKMLETASRHAKELGLSIKTLCAPFGSLTRYLNETYDAVFCLGNTLAHLAGEEQMTRALSDFHSLLEPGGVVVLQVVNLERILASGKRVQSVRERENRIFVRFYDFDTETIGFNVLVLERVENKLDHRLYSVKLHAIRREELERALQASGFSEPTLYGTIALDEFVAHSSPDLVALARKRLT